MLNSKWMRLASRLSGVVMAKTLALYGSYRLGLFLDRSWGSAPWMMLLLITVTACLGLWWLIYVLMHSDL